MKELKQEIQLEQAEFINRILIDCELSERDVKIGLCILHQKLKQLIQYNSSFNKTESK